MMSVMKVIDQCCSELLCVDLNSCEGQKDKRTTKDVAFNARHYHCKDSLWEGFVIVTQVLAEDATESKGATLLSQTNIILYSKRYIPMLKIDRGLKSKRVYAPLLLLSMYT